MSPLHSALRSCCPKTLRTCFAFLLLVSSLGFLLGVNGQAFGQCPPAPDMEIDGDAVDDPMVPGLDWDSVLGYNGFAGVQGTDTLSTDLIDDSWDPDSTTFTQGSADFDPISGPGGWTCVVGEVKGKNDIQNGAGVLFPDKIFYFMLDRLAIEGDAQIGFWLLGDDVDCHSTGSGSGAEDFVGNHQVNDLLVQIDFVGGGSVGAIKIWRWTGSGTLDTVSVNVTTGLACAVVNQAVIQAPWGVEQKNFDGPCPYPDVNGKGGCYGINTSPQGNVAGAFFEGYIDLQALLGGDLCTQTFIGETRSSQSPTASRDDWVRGAFVTKPTCEIADTTVCFAGNPTNVVVEADIVTPAGPAPLSWSVISGSAATITSDPTQNPVTVSFTTAGSVTVQLIVGDVDCADTCSAVITANPAPTCEITGPDPVCAGAQDQVYSSTVSPAGGTVTRSWSISGNGTIDGSTTGSSVTVDAGAAGSFTLTLDVTRDGCPGQCTKTVTVNANPTCEISGPDPVCAGTNGHVYTSAVSPPGGTVSYDWSISGNGTISGSDTGSSVTVNAGTAGSFTLTLDIIRDGCPGQCTKNVTVTANPTCEITGPDPVCEGESAVVYNSSVSPAGGTVSYDWSISGDGAIVGSDTGASVTVDPTGPGSFTLTLDVIRNSCPGQCTKTVTVNPGPSCEISGPDAVCAGTNGHVYTSSVTPPGGTVTYDWDITGNGTISGSDTGSSVTVNAGTAGSFTLNLTVSREGCVGTCSKTVTVNANPTCEITGPDPVCAGTDGHVYSSSVSPAGGTVSYDWSISGNGTISGSDTGSSVTVNAGAAGSFTLTLDIIRNGCPGQCTKTVTVNANPTCIVDGPTDPCTGSDENYSVTVSPSGGDVTYSWSVIPSDCGTIVGSSTSSSVVVNWAHSGPCTLRVEITRDECPGECELIVNPQNCNAEFCSFTQGYWGNEGGQKCFNDEQTGTLAILQALITPGNPLVIGKLGQRSITFGDGDEQCIIDLLPGGGTAGPLPDTFQDEEIGANCQTDPAIPTNPKSGRIRNILLSQTIALALNVRFDDGLCDLELCRYMTTVDADPGPDDCLGNDDDSPTLSGILTFEIPQSILDYLGAGATVCDLLTLANCKLAGDANLPDATLLSGAVAAINEGFDECRFLTECGPNPPFEQATGPIDTNRNRLDQNGAGFGEGVPVKFGLFGALPNPTRAMSMIRFALPEASNVRLTLYNIRGQEMKVLVNGVMEQGYKTVGLEMQGLPSGIYLYRLEAKGMESGAQFRESQKVLLIQ